jgi:hypothetical protein
MMMFVGDHDRDHLKSPTMMLRMMERWPVVSLPQLSHDSSLVRVKPAGARVVEALVR